jgi:hypothetical protein
MRVVNNHIAAFLGIAVSLTTERAILLGCCRTLRIAGFTRQLDIPRQAEPSQSADTVPIQIKFVPGETVTRQLWRSVVVVVPSHSKREKSHPEVVGGRIVGRETHEILKTVTRLLKNPAPRSLHDAIDISVRVTCYQKKDKRCRPPLRDVEPGRR